ncbi:Uncharacterized protein FWK35_00018417 [Aphis craccivora]|uniref:Uncharacterized protein n=1 Tax=Aphis craccivora TaxID=307492 RepID=A0A6G0Y6B3_APHCR|nr:Uncharacterized protein FWK35_00018417 [Aphis craccivora]
MYVCDGSGGGVGLMCIAGCLYLVIFRGDEDNQNVGEHFEKSIVEIAENIEKLLQTNIPITLTAEQQQEHNLCKTSNLCKNGFSVLNHKVADHCHLSSKFRQTLCNT